MADGEGGRGGCVTLGAMFAASRDARPGGGRACRGAAPPGPPRGRPGFHAPRGWRGSGSGGVAGRAEEGVRVPEGRGAPRARPGAERGRGGPGGGGGATASPPEAKFEKRMRFPPFFKPKNTTFPLLCPARLRPRPCPHGPPGFGRTPSPRWLCPPPRRRPGPCPRGRPAPRCGRPAAPRASRGAPQRHVGGRRLPPPGEPAALALPVGPRAASTPRARLRARSKRGTRPPPPPHPLAGALPLLKRATVADAGLEWPGPRTCSARPLRPTVRRPRARRRPCAARVATTPGPSCRLGHGVRWPSLAGARRWLRLTSWELVAMASLGAPSVPEALCSCHGP